MPYREPPRTPAIRARHWWNRTVSTRLASSRSPALFAIGLRMVRWHTKALVLEDLRAGNCTVADAVACWRMM